MSIISLIVIEKENIHFVQSHYRIIENLFTNEFKEMNWFMKVGKKWTYLDAGYIILDFNRKLIINAQSAIEVRKEGWEVMNLN